MDYSTSVGSQTDMLDAMARQAAADRGDSFSTANPLETPSPRSRSLTTRRTTHFGGVSSRHRGRNPSPVYQLYSKREMQHMIHDAMHNPPRQGGGGTQEDLSFGSSPSWSTSPSPTRSGGGHRKRWRGRFFSSNNKSVAAGDDSMSTSFSFRSQSPVSPRTASGRTLSPSAVVTERPISPVAVQYQSSPVRPTAIKQFGGRGQGDRMGGSQTHHPAELLTQWAPPGWKVHVSYVRDRPSSNRRGGGKRNVVPRQSTRNRAATTATTTSHRRSRVSSSSTRLTKNKLKMTRIPRRHQTVSRVPTAPKRSRAAGGGARSKKTHNIVVRPRRPPRPLASERHRTAGTRLTRRSR